MTEDENGVSSIFALFTIILMFGIAGYVAWHTGLFALSAPSR